MNFRNFSIFACTYENYSEDTVFCGIIGVFHW